MGNLHDHSESLLPGNEYFSLDTIKQEYPSVKQVFEECQKILETINTLYGHLLSIPLIQPKHSSPLMTYPLTESKATRTPGNDRVFPLDTVTLQRFRTNHDSDLESAVIHIGPYANEMARSFNALALTIGKDIFFRANSYNSSSEEGQKTLVHELTHVSQYQKDEINNKTQEVIEAEADKAEQKEFSRKDNFVSIKLNENRYLVEKSKLKYYAKKSAEGIKEWLMMQKTMLDEKEYFSLLCDVDKWLEK